MGLPMTFHLTALYAPLLTILVLVLATLVTMKRVETGVSILHGDNMDLALSIRRHGNLVENLPLALILMGLCEARGLPPLWLHVMGILLVVARLTHAVGLSSTNPATPLRIAGGAGTQLAMLGAIVFLLWSQF
ncbi:MAG: hypothetical protein JWR75_2134 [Devosia sp.]|nr:hypothetical protein [Devosia sp.]